MIIRIFEEQNRDTISALEGMLKRAKLGEVKGPQTQKQRLSNCSTWRAGRNS